MNKQASLLLFAGGAAFALAARRGSKNGEAPDMLANDEATPPSPPSAATFGSMPDVTMAPSPTAAI
jgi:hypothetical protein